MIRPGSTILIILLSCQYFLTKMHKHIWLDVFLKINLLCWNVNKHWYRHTHRQTVLVLTLLVNSIRIIKLISEHGHRFITKEKKISLLASSLENVALDTVEKQHETCLTYVCIMPPLLMEELNIKESVLWFSYMIKTSLTYSTY